MQLIAQRDEVAGYLDAAREALALVGGRLETVTAERDAVKLQLATPREGSVISQPLCRRRRESDRHPSEHFRKSIDHSGRSREERKQQFTTGCRSRPLGLSNPVPPVEALDRIVLGRALRQQTIIP